MRADRRSKHGFLLLSFLLASLFLNELAFYGELVGSKTHSLARHRLLNAAQLKQWNNKTLNTTYEPGSTFKPIVVAAGLEEGTITDNSTFVCTGKVHIGDWDIRCSARSGHGTQTLRRAVMNSCNPALIKIGQSLGEDKFREYWENFGFTSTTGIELPGEQKSVFWTADKFGETELATASFGQRFTTTPIQLIRALSAVINGGHLMEPYVVQSVTDDDGNVTGTKTVRVADMNTVSGILKDYGLINYKWLFQLYSRFSNAEVQLSPGTYALTTNLDYRALVKKMQTGADSQLQTLVMFPEGYNLDQVFRTSCHTFTTCFT